MKYKIPAIWQWIIIILVVLTIFYGYAACSSLEYLKLAGEKTEQEQKNLLELIEFQIVPDESSYQTFNPQEYDTPVNEEKNSNE